MCAEVATQKNALEIVSIIRKDIDDTSAQNFLESSSHQTNGVLLLKHVQHTLLTANKDKREKLVFSRAVSLESEATYPVTVVSFFCACVSTVWLWPFNCISKIPKAECVSGHSEQLYPARSSWGGGGGYPYPIMLCNITQNSMGQTPGGGTRPGPAGGGGTLPGLDGGGGTLPGDSQVGYPPAGYPPGQVRTGGYLTWVQPPVRRGGTQEGYPHPGRVPP